MGEDQIYISSKSQYCTDKDKCHVKNKQIIEDSPEAVWSVLGDLVTAQLHHNCWRLDDLCTAICVCKNIIHALASAALVDGKFREGFDD